MPIKKMQYPVQVKVLTDDAGEPTGMVEFYASIYGNVDLVGDRVMEGAFDKSIGTWRASRKMLPVVFSHKWDSPFDILGYADPKDLVSDKIGLKVRAMFDIKSNPTAMQVFQLMKRGIIDQASFAYEVKNEVRAKDGANNLLELEIIEVGPCLKGANPATGDYPVTVKSYESRMRTLAEVLSASEEKDIEVEETFDDSVVVRVKGDEDEFRSYRYGYTKDGEIVLGVPEVIEYEVKADDRADTLFDLSDKQHTQIAVGIVFGAEGERDGTPKDTWHYRGGVVGSDLSDADRAHVVARVRSAASKFGIDTSSSSDEKGMKIGRRNSAADQAAIQDMHDAAVQLGADCPMGEEKTVTDAETKAAPKQDEADEGVEDAGKAIEPGAADEDDVETKADDTAAGSEDEGKETDEVTESDDDEAKSGKKDAPNDEDDVDVDEDDDANKPKEPDTAVKSTPEEIKDEEATPAKAEEPDGAKAEEQAAAVKSAQLRAAVDLLEIEADLLG